MRLLPIVSAALILLTGLPAAAKPENPAPPIQQSVRTAAPVDPLDLPAKAQTERQRQAEASRDQEDVRAQKWMAASASWMAWLTGGQLLLAVATVLGLLFSLRQTRLALRQTDKLIEENRRFSHAELRAYFSVERFRVKEVSPGRWEVRARVTNRGKTPAKNVRLRFETTYVTRANGDIPWTDPLNGMDLTFGVFSPGMTARPAKRRSLTANQVAQLNAMRARLWTQVEVQYEDEFGKRFLRRASITHCGAGLSIANPTNEGNTEDELDVQP